MISLRKDNTKCPIPKKIHTGNIIQTEKIIFREIHVHTYTNMHVTMNKRGHPFERKQERRIWKEERERGYNYIIMSKIN